MISVLMPTSTERGNRQYLSMQSSGKVVKKNTSRAVYHVNREPEKNRFGGVMCRDSQKRDRLVKTNSQG